MSLAGHLNMNYKVEISAAFINHPTDQNVLKYGSRAVVWRHDDMYNELGEAEKPEDAFATLIASLKTPTPKPFINQYEDREVRKTIQPNDPEWSLSIYSPNMRMTDLPDNLTHATHPKAVTGEFQVVKSKSGDCKVLYFEGRNDLLKIQPRNLITLWHRGEALFYGPAVWHPDHSNSTPGAIKVVGPRENLNGYLVNEPIRGRLSIQDFLKEIFRQIFKGPVTFNPDKIHVPDLVLELSQHGYGFPPVSAILDQLVLKLPGGRWGVDAEGELFVYARR